MAQQSDRIELASLYHSLWPESSVEEHSRQLATILAGKTPLPLINLAAETATGRLVGFLEVGLRSHADGCDPSRPVGFIEGWYVAPEYRRQGIGQQLLAAAEAWARDQGCSEMASDTQLDNHISQTVHQAFGYEVVDRCVHFRKPL